MKRIAEYDYWIFIIASLAITIIIYLVFGVGIGETKGTEIIYLGEMPCALFKSLIGPGGLSCDWSKFVP